VIAGLLLARLWPALAARLAAPVSKASSILLFALLVPVLFRTSSAVFAQSGNFTILAMILFIGIGLAIGHLLGGPDPDNRTTLALATATRHPGVAIAVLHAIAPDEEGVAPAVLLYLIVAVIASIPYLKWRTRARVGAEGS
jgi:bile acid:Na+ symporter, BASS family